MVGQSHRAEMEVTARIAAAGPSLTAAERRVAQAVLERPQLVAFGTVADLAKSAKAGAATVVRLAGKLGFDGFSALQACVQGDLSHQLRPAAERIRDLDVHQPIERHRAAALANVQETLDGVDPSELDKVVDLLSDHRRPVLVAGSEPLRGVVSQFVRELGSLRGGVAELAGSEVAVRQQVAVAPADTTVVVADVRRYERAVLDALALSRESGHTVVALSDGPLSPLAMAANHSFTVVARSLSPFESQVGTLALLELLVASAAERLKPTATERLDRVELAWNAAGSLTDA